MVVCKVKSVYRDKKTNVILGYKLVDKSGNEQNIESAKLKQSIINQEVYVTNLTLTSDHKLRLLKYDKLPQTQDNSQQNKEQNKEQNKTAESTYTSSKSDGDIALIKLNINNSNVEQFMGMDDYELNRMFSEKYGSTGVKMTLRYDHNRNGLHKVLMIDTDRNNSKTYDIDIQFNVDIEEMDDSQIKENIASFSSDISIYNINARNIKIRNYRKEEAVYSDYKFGKIMDVRMSRCKCKNAQIKTKALYIKDSCIQNLEVYCTKLGLYDGAPEVFGFIADKVVVRPLYADLNVSITESIIKDLYIDSDRCENGVREIALRTNITSSLIDTLSIKDNKEGHPLGTRDTYVRVHQTVTSYVRTFKLDMKHNRVDDRFRISGLSIGGLLPSIPLDFIRASLISLNDESAIENLYDLYKYYACASILGNMNYTHSHNLYTEDNTDLKNLIHKAILNEICKKAESKPVIYIKSGIYNIYDFNRHYDIKTNNLLASKYIYVLGNSIDTNKISNTQNIINKHIKDEDKTVLFYGENITKGATIELVQAMFMNKRKTKIPFKVILSPCETNVLNNVDFQDGAYLTLLPQYGPEVDIAGDKFKHINRLIYSGKLVLGSYDNNEYIYTSIKDSIRNIEKDIYKLCKETEFYIEIDTNSQIYTIFNKALKDMERPYLLKIDIINENSEYCKKNRIADTKANLTGYSKIGYVADMFHALRMWINEYEEIVLGKKTNGYCKFQDENIMKLSADIEPVWLSYADLAASECIVPSKELYSILHMDGIYNLQRMITTPNVNEKGEYELANAVVEQCEDLHKSRTFNYDMAKLMAINSYVYKHENNNKTLVDSLDLVNRDMIDSRIAQYIEFFDSVFTRDNKLVQQIQAISDRMVDSRNAEGLEQISFADTEGYVVSIMNRYISDDKKIELIGASEYSIENYCSIETEHIVEESSKITNYSKIKFSTVQLKVGDDNRTYLCVTLFNKLILGIWYTGNFMCLNNLNDSRSEFRDLSFKCASLLGEISSIDIVGTQYGKEIICRHTFGTENGDYKLDKYTVRPVLFDRLAFYDYENNIYMTIGENLEPITFSCKYKKSKDKKSKDKKKRKISRSETLAYGCSDDNAFKVENATNFNRIKLTKEQLKLANISAYNCLVDISE